MRPRTWPRSAAPRGSRTRPPRVLHRHPRPFVHERVMVQDGRPGPAALVGSGRDVDPDWKDGGGHVAQAMEVPGDGPTDPAVKERLPPPTKVHLRHEHG